MKSGVFPFERFLQEYDVWELHPLDQGGLSEPEQQELLDSIETHADNGISLKIRRGRELVGLLNVPSSDGGWSVTASTNLVREVTSV